MTTRPADQTNTRALEALTKAHDCARFALDDLRDAMGRADPVLALLLEPAVIAAAELSQRLRAIRAAVEAAAALDQ